MIEDILQRIRDPNLAGELLRDITFVPDEHGGTYGCYSTFDLADGFKPLEPRTPNAIALARAILNGDTPDDPIKRHGGWEDRPTSWSELHLHSNGTIHMGWHWDGDGTLAYIVGKILLVNDDCKKDHTWRALPTLEPRLIDAGPWHGPKTASRQYLRQYLEDPLFGPFNKALLGMAHQGYGVKFAMDKIILAACKKNPDTSILERYGHERDKRRIPTAR